MATEALQVLASEEYDLLILDLRMPGVDGITVIEALRVSGNRVPVILCSAEFTPGTFLRAVRCDVVDFLLKPANPAQIRSAVEFVLEPTPDALSQAMKSAREGDTAAAIRILESARLRTLFPKVGSKSSVRLTTGKPIPPRRSPRMSSRRSC